MKKVSAETGPTSVAATKRDALSGEAWSKPVLDSLDARRPTAEGVYLATAPEARQLASEVRAQGALAILLLTQVGTPKKEHGPRFLLPTRMAASR